LQVAPDWETTIWTPADRALVGDFGAGLALTDNQFWLLEPLILAREARRAAAKHGHGIVARIWPVALFAFWWAVTMVPSIRTYSGVVQNMPFSGSTGNRWKFDGKGILVLDITLI
jgi:hypothetical protein